MDPHSGLRPASGRPRIVFAVDEAFCLPLTVTWQSLRVASPELCDTLQVDVLYEELAETSTGRLRQHADRLGLRVVLRQVNLKPIHYPTAFGGAHANYLRLIIPELYEDCDRLLYLDSDLLIRGDLRGLLDTDLAGAPIGAVRDPLNPLVGRGRALPGWSKLGIPASREYFNSGVMLIDPAVCRQQELFRRAVDFIATRPEHIRLWDQDALNWAAEDRWHRLDPRWNVFPISALVRTPWVRYTTEDIVPFDELAAMEAEPAILHYASPAKPWRGLLPEGPSASLYQNFLRTVQDYDREAAANLA
ncbi:glycosyltransferase family 8 protein [Streptosporangium sp. NPDC004631]